MTIRSACAVLGGLTLVLLGHVIPASGQPGGPSSDIPRTADGRPDLRGVWANNTATPLQRPDALADQERFSSEEVAELRQRLAEIWDREQAGDLLGDSLILQALDDSYRSGFDAVTGNYNSFWLVQPELDDDRTSLIVDPPNGRIPPLTDAAQQRQRDRARYRREHPADTYADRPPGDRCITTGPWLLPGYNSYVQIFQTPDHVGMLQELHHQVRIVPLTDRPALAPAIRLWSGDHRGRWEGDTLVVDTANFSEQASYQGATADVRLVQRYTLMDRDTLRYTITLSDSRTWVRPWTVVLFLKRSADPIFEYACHEGNYAMEGILAGHRSEERAAP